MSDTHGREVPDHLPEPLKKMFIQICDQKVEVTCPFCSLTMALTLWPRFSYFADNGNGAALAFHTEIDASTHSHECLPGKQYFLRHRDGMHSMEDAFGGDPE